MAAPHVEAPRWIERSAVIVVLVLVLVVYVRADVIIPALVCLALLTAGEVAIGRGLRHRGGTHTS
ncbi:MAG TPA: hypothetical protein PKY70_16195 [Nakamurella multipartita]|nr:hypothetical protein [Nakamurella multipartita]